MKVITFKKTLLALSVAAALSACGGSDSVTPSGDSGGGTPLVTSISGIAAKGIIIGGNVVANELNADKTVKNANVGSATTDSKGAYSLDLNNTYQGGPIEIKVTTSASTLVVCDVSGGCGTRTDDVVDASLDTIIDFGEQYKPGVNNLSMTALLPDAKDGESISVQITPFTHMAAVQALSGSTVDAKAINDANSSVSALLGGLDILSLEPVDITDLKGDEGATAVTYAALSAAIAELAPTNTDGQPDINAAVANLASSFSNGAIKVEDSGNTDDVIALQEILDQTNAVLTQAGATDTTGVIADLQSDVDTAVAAGNGDSSITPTPNANAGDTDVAKAKAFLTDLRTWGTTIQGEVEAPSAAFDTQLMLSDDAAGMIQGDTTEVIAYGAMAILQYFAGDITSLDQFVDENGTGVSFSQGTLSTSGNEYTLSGGQATIGGVAVSLTMTLVAPADGSSSKVMSFGVKNITAEDVNAKVEVAAGSISITLESAYTIDYSALNLGTAAAIPNPEKIDFNFAAVYAQKQTLSAGALVTATDPVSFAANLSATLFTYVNAGEIVDVLPGSFSASGTVSNTTGDSFDVGLSVSIPTASTVVNNPVQALPVGSTYAANNGGDSLVSWTVTPSVFTYTHPYNAFTATLNANGSVSLDQNGFMNTIVGPYLSLTVFLSEQSYLLNDYLYNFHMGGQGEYTRVSAVLAPDYTANGSIAFGLDYPEIEFFGATQPLLATIGVQFSVQFNGLAEANVSVTGTSTAFEKGNADVSISYGVRKLQFIVSNNNATPNEEAASIEITNQDNVKLILRPKGLNNVISDEADVTINGNVIATIKDVNGFTRVEYIDGTFESL